MGAMETDCEKCLHQKVCALWGAHESQDASCFSLDGCDYFEAALTPPNEWVSVKERRPQAGHDVIALLPCGDCAVVWWTGSVWRVRWDATQLDREPTHWMPLPAPPDRRLPEGEADA